MMTMDLGQIEENVEALDTSKGFDFVYDLLAAYGFPKATLARLKKGTDSVAPSETERVLRNKLYYRYLEAWETGEDLHAVIDTAASDDKIATSKPRFLIVRDQENLVAIDQLTKETLDTPLERLHLHASFFLPWAGIEKTQLEAVHFADIKAAEKMARLYDEIRKVNEFSTDVERHALNVFFSRLLFCFFAEDTGIFEPGQVTTAIGSLTRDDGSDLDAFLNQLFDVLDTPMQDRGELSSYLTSFGYVNGSLFSHRTRVPTFSAKARKIILECAELDWSDINPDIFGSMMQAVVHTDQRAGLGMHYTSVENIMKVLRPLFLDDLEDSLAAANDPRKLLKLHDRISKIKVFDPACGSGNFLVIGYKELRSLEHRILERLRDLEADPKGTGLFEVSRISLDSLYGIEIDDFAAEIARLSLWLAKHQIDKQFEALFGSHLQMIPLRQAGNVHAANATRVSWEDICRGSGDDEIFVCGNPPYVGSSMQTPEQKKDFITYFGDESYSQSLDYVSLWILKAADYAKRTASTVGFVVTNSVCQGDHVAALHPKIMARGVKIVFAHQSFRWSNQARGGAGVSCAVLGLSPTDRRPKRLFKDGSMMLVEHIDPYLRPTNSDVIVTRSRTPINSLPPMLYGSKPTDGGHLLLTRDQMNAMLNGDARSEVYIRTFIGADEYLNGLERYCIWVSEDQVESAGSVDPIRERAEAVKKFRQGSKKKSTRELARYPYRFGEIRFAETPAIIVPRHSSERRDYVPMGFVGPETVISDSANAIYDAEPWLFGLIQSRMHMAWLRAVGGKLKTDYRYSAVLVYNTFPVPTLADADKAALTTGALSVLAAREQYPDRTLAELYDPDKMPQPLRSAHEALDDTVDRLYRSSGFASDDERLELLFEMYEEMTSKQKVFDA